MPEAGDVKKATNGSVPQTTFLPRELVKRDASVVICRDDRATRKVHFAGMNLNRFDVTRDIQAFPSEAPHICIWRQPNQTRQLTWQGHSEY